MDKIFCYLHPDGELYDDYRTGDVICTHCGLVILERCLGPYENSLIYKENYDNFPNENSLLIKLNVPSILLEIAEKSFLCDSAIKMAAEIYEKINKLKCFKKVSSQICCAVSIFTACRKISAPRTFAEISNTSNIPVKIICKYYKIVANEIDEIKTLRFTNNSGLITRMITNFNLPYMVEKEAEKYYNDLKRKYPNKSPNTLTAASVYLSSQKYDINIDKNKIAEFIDIHPITLIQFLRIINNENLKHAKSDRQF